MTGDEASVMDRAMRVGVGEVYPSAAGPGGRAADRRADLRRVAFNVTSAALNITQLHA